MRRERVANTTILKVRPLTKLVLATHDTQVAALCADVLQPAGVTLLSLTDVGLPEPAESGSTTLNHAIGKASVVAWFAGTPALGIAQEFGIDPQLRYVDVNGPRWTWPIPLSSRAEIYAEIKMAHDELNRGGYCGPDDRGAFIRCVLSLTWPDMESLVIEARVDGQLGAVASQDSSNAADVLSDYVLPDGEDRTMGSLSLAARLRYSALHRAINKFRDLVA